VGEPIKLPDGRIAYGRAQAAAMWAEREEVASEPTEQIILSPAPAESVSFQSVRGIGPSIEAELYNAEILTWEDVLTIGVVEINRRIPGIGMGRARALFAMAQREAE